MSSVRGCNDGGGVGLGDDLVDQVTHLRERPGPGKRPVVGHDVRVGEGQLDRLARPDRERGAIE